METFKLGSRAAALVVVIGVAYVVVLGVGFARFGFERPITDPVLAVMEVLTLLSAVPMVVAMAAVHAYAAADRKVYGVVALAFTLLFAGTTSAVHFVELTAARQLGTGGMVWPSAAYAAELLAWDWFLGLALLFAVPVFPGAGAERRLRWALWTAGVLCLAGTAGPLVGDMRLQRVGILGYAVVLPVAFFLLARLLRARSRGAG